MDNEFITLLAHYPPSSSDKQVIQEVVSKVSIDSELVHLACAEDQLQRIPLQQQGVISTLQRIPNEILGEIMKWCLPNYDPFSSDYNYWSPNQSQCMTLTLASICSHWREVAISTPQLWTVIIWETSKNSLLLLQKMLSRSGECDLELHARIYSSKSHSVAMEALRANFHRMERIINANEQLTDIIVEGPSLQHLRTLQITTELATGYLLKVFKNCPFLEDAEIFIDDTVAVSVSFQGLIMHSLRRLLMSSDSDPAAFLDVLTTPKLLEFTDVPSEPSERRTTRLIELLRRSKASLRILDVRFIGGLPDRMHAVLDSVPHLSELRLTEEYRPMKAVYEYLTVRAERAAPLPDLMRLTIHDERTIIPEALHQMIVSRAAECPLKQITLYFDELPSFQNGPFAKLWQDRARLGYKLEIRNVRDCVIDIDKHGNYAAEF